MKELLKKLTSYNLFNYLLPGIVFAVVGSNGTKYHLVKEDIVTGIFYYYFLGLVISRIGSILIEPFLEWLGIVKFAPYADFVKTSAKDKKLDILSEAKNMYRTISALILSLLLLKLWEVLESALPFLANLAALLALLILGLLFVLSYRKQTNYITKRIAVGLQAKARRPRKSSKQRGKP